MNPNQLYYRHVTLGGRAVLWLFGWALVVLLIRLAWFASHQRPVALGIELASAFVLVSFFALPPCWNLIGRFRRRYRARGLLRVKHYPVAVTLIGLGAFYGLVFPCAVLVELIGSSHEFPIAAVPAWIYLAYLVKVGLALMMAKAGFTLLAHSRTK